MIICNGSPKTGTHLLLKAVVMFGGECKLALHSHNPYPHTYGALDKHLHITRSPRNVVASWMRFTKIPFTEENYCNTIQHIVDEMSGYIGWVHDPYTFHVKYEELLTDEKYLKDLAKFINKDLKIKHFENIWGGTPTFTGEPCIWRDFWTPAMAVKWVECGGLELETSLGYDPTKVWIRKKP